ncbi:ECF-type sigma factor [Dokdonella sp.]|uniref:ECF-type sigma factor n=1 Tax=Dokdonella sp. TaxID=2291710 RepID=UPI001B23298C|nr:ECF-type sigma factor [Dokdonella sp.]MBO9661697.1 hypothetical protein [Dokdonella sp.]
MPAKSDEATSLIQAWQAGDVDALSRLLPLVYADLRAMAAYRLAGEENGPGTSQPTALVHDVFLRMAGAERLDITRGALLCRAYP